MRSLQQRPGATADLATGISGHKCQIVRREIFRSGRPFITSDHLLASKKITAHKILTMTQASSTETATTAAPAQPTPPPETKFPVRLDSLKLTPQVTLLRATCDARLPEIQFNQRLGTTTNSYLISSTNGSNEVLLDVPSKVYDYEIFPR